jgi:predicted CxxxxCH...CXXCH cytochrome family protein
VSPRLRRIALSGLWLAAGCHEQRTQKADAVYADVAPLFEESCLSCHGPDEATAGYSLATHWDVLGCVPDNRPATEPHGPEAPLVSVLAQPDHASLLSHDEQQLLTSWVTAGSPAFVGSVHPAGIVDPRSADWHGKLAAQHDFAPLHDPASPNVCGRCHAGAPVRPEEVVYPAPSATPCTDCHASEAGVFACNTCHGTKDAAYPPRDACYFGEHGPDAHAAHLTGTRFLETPLACDTCHAVPPPTVFAGEHANGTVEVAFARFPEGGFDAGSQTCAVYCHAQQGMLTMPHWQAGEQVECQSCHQSPPADHYPGQCSDCHAEMGASAESLSPGALHLNGQIDLGDGGETCASCHGSANSAAPDDANHRLHLASPLTTALVCSDCHPTPSQVKEQGHLDGKVQVVLGARAHARGQEPVWNEAEQRCSSVACHGAALPGHALSPSWGDAVVPAGDRCETCHAAPPPPPHVVRSSCGGGLCHMDEVGLIDSQLRISEPGRLRHIDGMVSPPYPAP